MLQSPLLPRRQLRCVHLLCHHVLLGGGFFLWARAVRSRCLDEQEARSKAELMSLSMQQQVAAGENVCDT